MDPNPRTAMAEYVDRDIQIPVPCPRCRMTAQLSLRSLERCDLQRCVSCGERFRVESEEFHRKLRETDRLVEDLLSELVDLVADRRGEVSPEGRRATPDNLVV